MGITSQETPLVEKKESKNVVSRFAMKPGLRREGEKRPDNALAAFSGLSEQGQD